jgi:hypothetical protein
MNRRGTPLSSAARPRGLCAVNTLERHTQEAVRYDI